MKNLAKLDFVALHLNGDNYLSWVIDAKIYLEANGLGETIKEGNSETDQQKAKAMIFLRHNLDERLKIKYHTEKDPLELWNSLKERYEHQRTVILPKARYQWMYLRFQDFKTVSEYNSALFKISSRLKLYGEKITDSDMIEKTLSTFHTSNVVLQQQYRVRRCKKYSDLIGVLLVAEQMNELVMKNHENRPTGSAPFPEVNVNMVGPLPEVNAARYPNHWRGRHRGHGRGRGRNYGKIFYRDELSIGGPYRSLKWERKDSDNSKRQEKKKSDDICYRCDKSGHWSRTCRAPKSVVNAHLKNEKGKNVETNYVTDGVGQNTFPPNLTLLDESGLDMTIFEDLEDL